MSRNFIQLGEIAEILVGLPTKRRDADKSEQTVMALTVKSLTETGIDSSMLIYVRPVGFVSDKYRVRTGDVLVPARSTSLKPCVVPESLDGTIFNSTLISVRCHTPLDPHLLVAYMLHHDGREALANLIQSGTAQMNITVKGLAQLQVPVPTLKQQQQFVKVLKASEKAYLSALQAAQTRREIARQIVVSGMMSDNE